MALYTPEMHKVTRIWHPPTSKLTERMSPEERQAVEDKLLSLIGAADLNPSRGDGQIHTTSWIPGSNRSGTAYDPIYLKPAKGNEELAAKLFGLFCQKVFMGHAEDWGFGRYEVDGRGIKGMTYFRIQRPTPEEDRQRLRGRFQPL